MTSSSNPKPFSFYKEHPKLCHPKDFWGQVKRTVNGKPVTEQQITQIVDAVIAGLELGKDDVLLDLCCGNGALTDRFFDVCRGGLGVDFSERLIEVAQLNFERKPDRLYLLDDVVNHVRSGAAAKQYTRILCYGSFAYLEHQQASNLLRLCRGGYPNVSRFFIGNCPDKEKMYAFFDEKTYSEGIEDEPDSPIGIWRSQEEFRELCEDAGWKVRFSRMPKAFYASAYRYDAVLHPLTNR